jgi:hypothetical protein
MATSLAQKLKIKQGASICTINAPSDFKEKLQPLPPRFSISTNTNGCDQIHWFVENRSQMEKELTEILAANSRRYNIVDLLSKRELKNSN